MASVVKLGRYKMIISIAGDLGSGKSSARKLLAEKLGCSHLGVGDMFRKMAAEKGLSIHEMNEIVIKNPHMDREMDERVARIANEKGSIVVDGHVLWHFLPQSLKVFLEVDIDEAARRLFEERRSSEKENKTLEDTKQGLINRAIHEEKRYASVYNLEYRNLDNFDVIINTTNLSPSEVVNKILEEVEKRKKDTSN